MTTSNEPTDTPHPVRPASAGGNPYLIYSVLNQPDLGEYEKIGLANSIGYVRKDNTKLLMDAGLLRRIRGFDDLYYHHTNTQEDFTEQLRRGARLFERKGLIAKLKGELLGIGIPQNNPAEIHGLVHREFAPFIGWPIRFTVLVPIIGEGENREIVFVVRKGDKKGEYVLDLVAGGTAYDKTSAQGMEKEAKGEMGLKIKAGTVSLSQDPKKQKVEAVEIGEVYSNETREDGRLMRRIITVYKARLLTDTMPRSGESQNVGFTRISYKDVMKILKSGKPFELKNFIRNSDSDFTGDLTGVSMPIKTPMPYPLMCYLGEEGDIEADLYAEIKQMMSRLTPGKKNWLDYKSAFPIANMVTDPIILQPT